MANKLFASSDTVSIEMIEQQLDDKVVTDLTDRFNKLISMTDKFSNKLVSSISYFRFPETKKVIDEIDNIILNRFKVKTQHISGESIGYAVLTVPPVNTNVLAGDVESTFKTFKQMLGKDGNGYVETTEKDVKNKKYIKDIFRDEKSVVYHTYMSFVKLENILKSASVKIDLKNATITNLPADYNLFIIADFYMLINKYKANARELTAALLHEVGHGFTHLEYSYRTVQTTTLIMDSIRDNINNGKTRKDAFQLTYKNVLDGTDDLTKYPEAIAVVKLIDKYMSNTLSLHSDDRHSFTDSEQLADQFANRFGVGDSLATMLNKLHGDNIEKPNRRPDTIILLCFISLILLTVGLIFFPMVITALIVYSIIVIIFGGSDSNATTYDTKVRRYERIRNDMVKLLRTTDLNKDIIRRLLDELDVVDKIIADVGNDTSILEKIGDLMPWNKNINRFQKLEELLEDMSENKLYISSNKIRTIKY